MNTLTTPLDDNDYLRFRELILNHSGLYFPEKKRGDLEIAVHKALQTAPEMVTTIQDLYRFLRYALTPEAKQARAQFINQLTVGETHFFRNHTHFDALATEVLPALIARKRIAATALNITPPAKPQLRLWSAGCATGEEAYSLAILLRELISDIDNWRILILATDINETSLAEARQAVYSDWSFREEQAKARQSLYFKPQGKGIYQLQDNIRQMVTFARHNLIEDTFPTVQNNTVSMDLIICRNVTIYFTPAAVHTIVNQFHETLVEGGWLVVGHAEPSQHTYHAFTGHLIRGTVLYQKTNRAANEKSAVNRTNSLLETSASADTSSSKKAKAPSKTRPFKPPRRTDLLPPLPPYTPRTNNESEVYETARNLLSNGRIEKAITLLESQINEQAPFAEAHCLLARAYADCGHWHKARFWCEKAIKTNPLLPEAYYVLAMIDEHEGKLEPAIHNLKKVVYLDQERPLAYFNLAMLYKKRAQVGLAKRALKNAIRKMQPWPPDKIIPDSGHTRTSSLSTAAQQLLADLGNSESASYE